MPFLRTASGERPVAMWLLAIFFFFVAAPLPAQIEPGGLNLPPNGIVNFETQLLATLAGPHERAFLQILTDVSILHDDTVDTAFVYDLMVRFDPQRYRAPHAGVYPLNFADQFILWGKRIARYTVRSKWLSSRFYLHDISTGHQAWIFTEETRRLYFDSDKEIDAERNRKLGSPQWLAAIYKTEPGTDLRTMGRWLQGMREESRDLVMQRNKAARATLGNATGN